MLAIGFITGVKQGLVKQAAGLVGLVLGLLLSKKLYLTVAAKLTPLLGMSERTGQIVAFVLILILVPMVFSVVALFISRLMKGMGLGWINRLVGGCIGLVEYMLCVGLLITLLETFDISGRFVDKQKKEASILYYPIYNISGVLINDVRKQIEECKGKLKTDEAESTSAVSTEDDNTASAVSPKEEMV